MKNEDSDEIATPICEICYLIDNTLWEPESVDQHGRVIMRLTEIVVPSKVNTDIVEICEECGGITVAGIYELRNPEDAKNRDEDGDYKYWDTNDDPTSFILDLYPDSEERYTDE
jgi:hypothetical protein